jgi:hypothetical protein
MKSVEWAVILSILLQASKTGIFFLATTVFVSTSYKYLHPFTHATVSIMQATWDFSPFR